MRAALLAMLLLAAAPAWAAWTKVAEEGGTTIYVDPAAVGVSGNVRRAPVVQDYAQAESGGVRSRQVLYEVDCAAERLRSLAVSEHDEPMAQGKWLASAERESDWIYVASRTGSSLPPRTPYRPIVRFVCAYR